MTSRFGLGDPELHAVQRSRRQSRILLGVYDTAASAHQVQLTGDNELFRPQTVAMEDLTTKEPCHRLKPGMGMRRYVGVDFGAQAERTHVIDETPGSDGSSTPGG